MANRKIIPCVNRMRWSAFTTHSSCWSTLTLQGKTFACKKCKKCFRKEAQDFDERYRLWLPVPSPGGVTDQGYSDEYCPHCDNHFVLDAITPKPTLKVEGEDVRIDGRYVHSARNVARRGLNVLVDHSMLRDDRIRGDGGRSIFNRQAAEDRLG